MANLKSKRYAIRFRQYSNYENTASEALMYILYNKGDIVMNANNNEDALERIGAYLNSYIKYKYKYLLASHVNRSISLDEVIKSKPLYVEKESFDNDNSIIQEMQSLYDNGLNNTETIDLIIQKYGLKEQELLDI